MLQRSLKFWFLTLAVAALLVAPVSAQILTIQPGTDKWNTPNNGNSSAHVTGAQLDQLCGTQGNAPADVPVKGQNLTSGENTDTEVTRTDPVSFYAYGDTGTTGIYVSAASFVSINPVSTNCGALNLTFTAIPPDSGDPTATMDITLESANGGKFRADIVMPMTITADNGGSTSYTYVLPSNVEQDWSVQPPANATHSGNFHPGVPPGGGPPLEFCRGKWLPAWHCYKTALKTNKPCRADEEPVERVNAAEVEPKPCPVIVAN